MADEQLKYMGEQAAEVIASGVKMEIEKRELNYHVDGETLHIGGGFYSSDDSIIIDTLWSGTQSTNATLELSKNYEDYDIIVATMLTTISAPEEESYFFMLKGGTSINCGFLENNNYYYSANLRNWTKTSVDYKRYQSSSGWNACIIRISGIKFQNTKIKEVKSYYNLFPDYNNVLIDREIGANETFTYTMPQNGYVFASGYGNTESMEFYINDILITLAYSPSNSTIWNGCILLVKKGDVLKIVNHSSGFMSVLKVFGTESTNVDIIEQFHKYSTEEKIVGEWIDGKPVYEKNIITDFVAGQNAVFVAENMQDVISCTGTIELVGYIRPFPFWNQYGSYCVFTSIEDHNMSIASSHAATNVNLVVQYTKTTD